MNLPIQKTKDLMFYYRPDSSDPKVIHEVVEKHIYSKGFRDTDYKFDILAGERWLDLGANIGTFSVWAGKKGAAVYAYEPELETFEILQANCELNGLNATKLNRLAVVGTEQKKALLSLGKKGSEWRHTIMKKKTDNYQEVNCVNINDVLAEYPFDGIKMDIEGAELAILDSIKSFRTVTKLVFEYHLDIDKQMVNFWRRIELLKQHFTEVRFAKIDPGLVTYDFFPPSRIIYCWK